MSWICNQCETENSDTLNQCEVCDALAPSIKDFAFESSYTPEPIRINWHSENCDKVLLIYGDKEVDVTDLSTYNVVAAEDNLEISFLTQNKTTERKFTFALKYVSLPNILFSVSNHSLHKKRKKESSVLSWNISNAQSAQLKCGDTIQEIDLRGNLTVSPKETTTYTIIATGLDGKTTFPKQETVFVFEDSHISFRQSSEYVYPNSPVKLSWDVRNAKSVELVGFGNQPMKGSCIVDIKKETTFTLKVEDYFGMREKQLTVKTLPLPIIKTILVPTPTINQTVNVHTHIPQMQATVTLQEDYFSHLDTSKISLPLMDDLFIDDPPTIEMPKFHLHINLPKISWWNKIPQQIESLTSYIKEHYEKRKYK